MKYLLLVPVRNAEPYLPFFFKSIREINPQPDCIVWAVNNCTDKTVPMLKGFCDVPSEIIKLPDFSRNFLKQHGTLNAIAIARQRLWERAREINAEWTFMCDVDEFAVSTGILGMLSDWNVDFVVARVLQRKETGEYIVMANWLASDGTFLTRVIDKVMSLEFSDKLVLVRPIFSMRNILDSTPLWAWGFCCFSRRLVQDRRLKFHPLLGKTLSEDIGFCHRARKLGYKIHLDGITLVDHVIYSPKKVLVKFNFGKKRRSRKK